MSDKDAKQLFNFEKSYHNFYKSDTTTLNDSLSEFVVKKEIAMYERYYKSTQVLFQDLYKEFCQE